MFAVLPQSEISAQAINERILARIMSRLQSSCADESGLLLRSLLQLPDQLLHHREEVPGYRMDPRSGTGLVQLHQGRFGVLVEAEDLGPRAHVVYVLRGAGDAEGQDEPGVHADAGLTYLRLERQQLQVLGHLARRAEQGG